jgi:DNA-binding winged helix-turn-helix (wHTH) protein
VTTLGACMIDLTAHEARWPNRTEALTQSEVKLFAYLLRQQGKVVPRTKLLKDVWGYAPSVKSRTCDVAVARLRHKIEADPKQPAFLLTVKGKGYRLRCPSYQPTPIGSAALVGRSEALRALHLRQAEPLITLLGPPGIGKSRLLAAYVETRSGWVVDLVGVHSKVQLAERLSEATGVQLSKTADPVELLSRLPHAGIVALDNADTCLELVRPLAAAASPELPIRVSSRLPLDVHGESLFPVHPLDDHAAIALLRARTGRSHDRDPDLIACTGGMPLAIELAAGRLHRANIDALIRELTDSSAVLQTSGDGRHDSLPAVLNAAWSGLTDIQRIWLGRLAVFPGVFDLTLASWALADTCDSTIIALEQLQECALVHPVGSRLRLLPTVAQFARRQATDTLQVLRHIAHGLNALVGLDEQMWNIIDDDDGARRLHDIFDLATAVVSGLSTDAPPLALALGLRLGVVARWFRSPSQTAEIYTAILELAQGHPSEPAVRMWHLRALQRTGRAAQAAPLPVATPMERAHSAHIHALQCYDERRFDQGLVHVEDMLTIAQTQNCRPLHTVASMCAAQLHRGRGDLDNADKFLQHAVEAWGDHPLQRIVVTYHLVRLRVEQGRLAEAATASQVGLSDAKRLGLPRLLRVHQTARANVLELKGDLSGAERAHIDAGEGFERDGEHNSMTACFANAAAAALADGRPEHAKDHALRALRPTHKQRLSHHFSRVFLACALAELGQAGEARALLDAATAALGPIGDPGDQLAIAEGVLAACSGHPPRLQNVCQFETSMLRTALERFAIP